MVLGRGNGVAGPGEDTVLRKWYTGLSGPVRTGAHGGQWNNRLFEKGGLIGVDVEIKLRGRAGQTRQIQEGATEDSRVL